MIARQENTLDKFDIWAALAAPVPAGAISWRQDGRPIARDGRFIARFVAYIEATTVFERLDSVVPGEWDLTLELLPTVAGLDEDANQGACSFKCRLQVLGVIREDVGTGKDYKQAATDAFKRAAVRFGIGRELYAYEQNWVQLDGDGKFAKPVEDPSVVYARRHGGSAAARPQAAASASATTGSPAPSTTPAASSPASTNGASSATAKGVSGSQADEESCPKCGGRCFDNRAENDARAARGDKLRPDWKCRDRQCDGVVWREKKEKVERAPMPVEEDEIPF